MKYRLLFGGDLHKRMKDITTIRGYAKVCIDVELRLMELVRKLGCTHFISLGDWFDRGYGSDTAAALAHTDIDRLFAEQLNGNFYGLIGNHIRINMDSNPELFLIQPHSSYTTRHKIARKEQIIKTPDKLILNGVQISFMHYNKDAKDARDYKPLKENGDGLHIALFHSPLVIPTTQLNQMGMHNITNSESAIGSCLENVNLAIVGDIHKPLGTFKINLPNGGTTTMIVPGSLTNTDAGINNRHHSVDLPVIDIEEDGSCKISTIKFDLSTNRLTFIQKNEAKPVEKLTTTRGNNVVTMYEAMEVQAVTGSELGDCLSLNSFMGAQGYTTVDKQIIRTIMSNPEDINQLVYLHKSTQETLID